MMAATMQASSTIAIGGTVWGPVPRISTRHAPPPRPRSVISLEAVRGGVVPAAATWLHDCPGLRCSRLTASLRLAPIAWLIMPVTSNVLTTQSTTAERRLATVCSGAPSR